MFPANYSPLPRGEGGERSEPGEGLFTLPTQERKGRGNFDTAMEHGAVAMTATEKTRTRLGGRSALLT
jgi:hypothetical protein